MKNKILFLLLIIMSLNIKAQTPPNIPLVRLSESNDPDTIEQGIACINNAGNTYNDNAFYRFYDLQRYINNGTIDSGSFMLTNLEFAQSLAEENTMLSYFVGTIDRNDYYIPGSGDFRETIDLNNLTVLRSGNHISRSSDNNSLVTIPIDPLTFNTDQIVYYTILVGSGDLDTHSFSMGGNFSGSNSLTYFNSSGVCDLADINDSNADTISATSLAGTGLSVFGAIMNIYGISNPSAIGPPPNDICETAQTLTVGISIDDNPVDFTTLNATQDGGGCNTGNAIPMSNEIWMQCVIPTEGHLVVETAPDVATGNTSFVSGMDAWSGSCGSLTYLNCGSQSFSTHGFSSIVINGTPGETIYIRVFGNFVVPFSVSAYNPPMPSNLSCETAQPLNIGAIYEDESVEASFLWAENNLDGLWYSFVAPGDGNITLETGPDSRGIIAANTQIGVYFTGSCNNFTSLGSDLNGGEYNFSKLDLTGLTPGETYIFAVADWSLTFRAPFSVSAYNATVLNIEDNIFNGFGYFPNPVEHTLTFDSIKTIDQVIVYDFLGKEVLNLEHENETRIERMDMSNLLEGIYMLKISIDNQTKIIRVIKK